ncbi:sulfate adenylyltransferase subunit 1 [Variovorax sp. LT1R16]|uniref:sulfate adenylyltransferase subunit 1 n=1 Tax=Variovorax sp. LT1R16 TaxID=3443728 RepID=UPI003F4580F8
MSATTTTANATPISVRTEPVEVPHAASTSSARTGGDAHGDTGAALRFITCGSVDDGKSTLIGRLLVDSKTVLQDQLAGVQRGGETDLALLTDGLSAEREQGITIDVAYRYFATAKRKFIIGDAPGHEQYTRNMVTAASSADAAVVLVDATKLAWAAEVGDGEVVKGELLAQTRRHALLCHLLRVQSIVFAVNKLDAIADAELAFERITNALHAFAENAGVQVAAIVPISALKGWNVVSAHPDWCGYQGPALLELLEGLPVTAQDEDVPFAFPVQWVEKFSSSADTSQGRRVFWGRVASGHVEPGQRITVMPSGQSATVAQVLGHTRQPKAVHAGHSAGIVLDRELDVSRGDWLLAPDAFTPVREITATVAWLDDEPLVPGRIYWALQGHRWVKAKVARIVDRVDIATLESKPAAQLEANAIGDVVLALQQPLAVLPFTRSRALGSLVLVDTASHKTSAAVLIRPALG